MANSFANGAMPMMAVSGEQTLAFKNMLGGICFPMVGDGLTVTRLVLTSNSATDNLSGVFSADYNNGQPTLTYTSGGANSITLDCGAGVTLDATTATDFTIMVPAGSLANGFKLEAYNGEEKLFEKTNDATLGADFIARSVIKKVNSNLEVGEAQFAGLTFEAKVANSTVTFKVADAFYLWEYNLSAPSLEYSTDGLTWNSYILNSEYIGEEITLANIGDKVMFRGDNEALGADWISHDSETGIATHGYSSNGLFSCTGGCYVYGNVISLLDKENFATVTSVPKAAFSGLFAGNTAIYNHPNHPIELPATTLSYRCYRGMFYGCTNLNYIKCLATDISAYDCTGNSYYDQGWLTGVSSTGTFVKHPDMNSWTTGDDGIPAGWTVVDAEL